MRVALMSNSYFFVINKNNYLCNELILKKDYQ